MHGANPEDAYLISTLAQEIEETDDGHMHHKELDLRKSPFKAYLTHSTDKKTSLVVTREGEEQASIIIDEDDTIRINSTA